MQGIPNVYDAAFSVLEEDAADYDFVLPAGVYLSYFYQGSYQQNRPGSRRSPRRLPMA